MYVHSSLVQFEFQYTPTSSIDIGCLVAGVNPNTGGASVMLCTRELASFDSNRPHICFKANKSEKPGTDPRKPKGELIYVHVRGQMTK